MSPIHFCTCSNCNCTATILNGNGNIEVGHLFCIMWLNVGQFKILFQHTVTFELPDMNISSYNTTQFPITIKDKTANSDKVKDNAGVRDQLGAVHMKYLFEYSSFMNYNYLSKVVIFFLNFALSDVWNGQNIKNIFMNNPLADSSLHQQLNIVEITVILLIGATTAIGTFWCLIVDFQLIDWWIHEYWVGWCRMNAENEIHYYPLSSVE